LRMTNEPEQVIRYDLSGIPLPFITDSVYKSLFPLAHNLAPAPGTHIVVTGAAFMPSSATTTQHDNTKRQYNPSFIPPCPRCSGPRAFECQLMPNLINVFRAASASGKEKKGKQTDEERRAEVARFLKGEEEEGGKTGEKGSMEWGTCMIFSCVGDCCRTEDGKKEVKAGWSEEFVLVQWDA